MQNSVGLGDYVDTASPVIPNLEADDVVERCSYCFL
jgi:hypothetical protein